MKESHKNKFKTPEGYFESFNERLMKKISKEDSMIPQNDGFKMPYGYFNGLDKKILENLPAKGSKVILLQSYKPYYYTAAAIAALFLVIFTSNWNSDKALQFEDLNNTEIAQYFENNEFGLTSYEIAEAVDLNESEIVNINDMSVEEATLMDYLEENIDEYDEINLDYNENL
ncbi:MAG: hypothetical protein KJO73_07100 [Croceitalea sp.]|nr:hypothetical protein [Croceitalea sp.]